jgi:hypothetical protein
MLAFDDKFVPVLAALVTGLFGLVAGLALERLRQRGAVEQSERDARLDYEYDARKHLYERIEPLFFQLHERSAAAMKRIEDLAKRSVNGQLGSGGYLTDEEYYRPSLFYELVAPFALISLVREQMTSLDLSLDTSMGRQYQLALAIYDAFSSDFRLAKEPPSIRYDPNPDAKPAPDPWQGLLPREIEQPVQALLIEKVSGLPSLISYATFAEDFHKKGTIYKALDELQVIFEADFTPESRPVLWRVLVALYCSLRGLQLSRRASRSDDELCSPLAPDRSERLVYGENERDRAAAADAIRIGLQYVRQRLAEWRSSSATAEA